MSYVGIRVTDLERSLRFYRDGLGLVEKSRGTMSHGGVYLSLRDPETKAELELNWYPPGHPHATPYMAGEGLDHIAFDVDDARSKYRELVEAGAAPALEPWLEHGRY